MTKQEFNNLKIGDLLEDTNGLYRVEFIGKQNIIEQEIYITDEGIITDAPMPSSNTLINEVLKQWKI